MSGTTDSTFLEWMHHELNRPAKSKASRKSLVAAAAAAAASGSSLMTCEVAGSDVKPTAFNELNRGSARFATKERRLAVTSDAKVGRPRRLATAIQHRTRHDHDVVAMTCESASAVDDASDLEARFGDVV